MRRLYAILAVGLTMACASWAGQPEPIMMQVTTWTNAASTVSATNACIGWIEAITFDVTTATTHTGTLSVVAVPPVATIANKTLASVTAATADKEVRCRFDGTTTDGTANTSDPPERYMSTGNLVFSCADANLTNITFRAWIQYERKE